MKHCSTNNRIPGMNKFLIILALLAILSMGCKSHKYQQKV